MSTRLLQLFASGLLVFATTAIGQQHSSSRTNASAPARQPSFSSETSETGNQAATSTTFDPKSNRLPASIAIPGSVDLGLSTKYHTQTNRGALHNIQVDPSNPNRIHAVIMAAPNAATIDSTAGNYPTRNIFYLTSGDGGATWSTPKAISSVRAGFPDMILVKRGANYIPVIGAHRYVSLANKDFICALYVEMGNPGDGNFKETLTDRNATVATGTRDILWPSIAVSPDNSTIYMAASLNTTTSDKNFYPAEIGSFTLDGTGNATWNGWKSGPNGPQLSEGETSAGEYVLRVSPSGKLGFAWDNYDNVTPDLGLYFAESKDGGKTWKSTYRPLWLTQDSNTTTSGTTPTTVYLRPTNGLDMFYDGEKVKLVTCIDQDAELSANDVYLPNSGGIAFWNGDTNSAPRVLLSRSWAALDTGSFPSWNTGIFEPQGTVGIVYPTIARSTVAGKWGVYFQGWQNDFSTLSDGLIYPYSGIYEMHTADNGASWTPSAPVLENGATGTHFDYRYAEISNYNVTSGNNFKYTLMFGADTAAGLWNTGGGPGYDEVGWYAKQLSVQKVGEGIATGFNLSQNYPNPFNPSTTISFSLVKPAVAELTVTDVLGRTVQTLVNSTLSAGSHQVKFDAGSLPSGVYGYTLKVNGSSVTQRMVLSK